MAMVCWARDCDGSMVRGQQEEHTLPRRPRGCPEGREHHTQIWDRWGAHCWESGQKWGQHRLLCTDHVLRVPRALAGTGGAEQRLGQITEEDREG